MKRDQAAIRSALEAEGRCRVCGVQNNLDAHHTVPRSAVQNDESENLIVLCRAHHDLVERREMDIGPFTSKLEQAHAVSLVGLERARKILYPSCYVEAA